MLRKKNPKIRNTSIQDPFGRVSIHNKIKQQSTKMSVYFKTPTKPQALSAGFSPVLAGAASTDSLAPTTLTERDTETQTTVMRYSTNIHKVCGTHSIAHDNKCLKNGHTLIMYREKLLQP